MAVSVQSTIDIAATVPEIMEVLADVESLPEWSSAHRGVEILDADEQGWPLLISSSIAQFGISDQMTVRYEWFDGEVSWELAEPSATQKGQKARYTLSENADGTTHVVFDLEVELKVKLPGLIVSKAQKIIAQTATRGLKSEVESRLRR